MAISTWAALYNPFSVYSLCFKPKPFLLFNNTSLLSPSWRAGLLAKMYSRDSKSRKHLIKMDPNCAICGAPAQAACDCEAKGLDVAIKQAEDNMMRSIYTEIRLV